MALSMAMIQYSFEDWRTHPILTTIERTDGTASEDIVFPSITICKGSSFQPDNWALPELIFDFFEFHCMDENQCNKTEKTHKDFKQLLDKIYETLSVSVEKSYQEFELEQWTKREENKAIIMKMITMIANNYTTIKTLNDKLRKNMFNHPDIIIQNYIDEYNKIANETYYKSDNDTSTILTHHKSENDTDMVSGLAKFLIKKDLLTNTLQYKLGFALHTYASSLKKNYYDSDLDINDIDYISNCFSKRNMMDPNNAQELCNNADCIDRFHQILTVVNHQLELNVSLYDMPTFLNHVHYKENPTDYVQNFPCHAMCLEYNFLSVGDLNMINYLSKWKNFTLLSQTYPDLDFSVTQKIYGK